jgi:hypothetical protein
MNPFSQDSRSPRRDLKPGLPEYKPQLLTTGSGCSVLFLLRLCWYFNQGTSYFKPHKTRDEVNQNCFPVLLFNFN